MIARERLTDPPDPAAPKPKPREPFVRLPREVATHPPIRHRGAKNAVAESNRIPKLADLGLTPFEFVIAATLADLARNQLDAARHTFAFAAGARALKRERRFASKDLAFRVGRTTYQFMLAGRTAMTLAGKPSASATKALWSKSRSGRCSAPRA